MPKTTLVYMRHGARIDYAFRDQGRNWTATAERPYDSPLTEAGFSQATKAGSFISDFLSDHKLPAVTQVYSSPAQRCAETVSAAARAIDPNLPPVKLEMGVVESILKPWYKSWATPWADSTWGGPLAYARDKVDVKTLNPLASKPVSQLYYTAEAMTAQVSGPPGFDLSYVSKYNLDEYGWDNFEPHASERARLRGVVTAMMESHSQETVLVCSHGGPCHYLYQELVGDREGKDLFETGVGYTSIFVYTYEVDAETGRGVWECLLCNSNAHLGGQVLGGVLD